MVLTIDELQQKTELLISAPAEQENHIFHSDYEVINDDGDEQIIEAENFDKVITKGPVIFRRSYEGWESPLFTGDPTTGDVLRAMNASMLELKDYHHIFYEGYTIGEKRVQKLDEQGDKITVTFIDIITGS